MFPVWRCSVIEPMTSNAQLRLNTKPEQDGFSLPKMLLDVLFEEIAVVLRKNQVTSSFIHDFST